MDSECWRRRKRVCAEAVQLPAGEATEFLDRIERDGTGERERSARPCEIEAVDVSPLRAQPKVI